MKEYAVVSSKELYEPFYFDSYNCALKFQKDLSSDGDDAALYRLLSFRDAEDQPSLEEVYELKPGIDFPATLCRRSLR